MSTSICLITATVIVDQISTNSTCCFIILCGNSPAEHRIAIIVGAASQQLGGVPSVAEIISALHTTVGTARIA